MVASEKVRSSWGYSDTSSPSQLVDVVWSLCRTTLEEFCLLTTAREERLQRKKSRFILSVITTMDGGLEHRVHRVQN